MHTTSTLFEHTKSKNQVISRLLPINLHIKCSAVEHMCNTEISAKLAVKPMLCNEKFNAVFIPDLDPYTEKTKLAEIMGLHRNTIGKWHKWAKMIVLDYRAEAEKTSLMSRYQCWVIGEIYRLSLLLKRKQMICLHLRDNRPDYSILKFKQIYKDYSI